MNVCECVIVVTLADISLGLQLRCTLNEF